MAKTGPIFSVRRGTVKDARAMGQVAYRTVDLPEDRAEEECRRIVREPFAFSSVVTHREPGGAERLVGVLNGVLLTPWFSDVLLASTTPYFHNHVREATGACLTPRAASARHDPFSSSQFPDPSPHPPGVRRSASLRRTLLSSRGERGSRSSETDPGQPFPTAAEVGAANAGEGLDLFLAHYAVDPSLDRDENARVRGMFTFHFVEHAAGNRVRSLLVETVGRENTVMAESGGWETATSFPEWRHLNGILERDGPHLLRITHERAMEVQNLHMARLLQYRTPIFRFSEGARELLRFAAEGLTDTQITALHGLTTASVSSTWMRILKTVQTVAPDLAAAYPSEVKTRDRLALLAYLRHHPEELWPYGE